MKNYLRIASIFYLLNNKRFILVCFRQLDCFIYNLSLMDEKIKNIYNSHQKVE